MRQIILIAFMLAVVGVANGPAGAASPGCTGDKFRSFDYMIGTWIGRNVRGEVRGKAEVTAVLAGCSIRMHWTGRTYEGTNNNTYDTSRSLWQKAWFDNTGGVELSEGHIVQDALVYVGTDYEHGKAVELHRESWIPLPDGRVQEHYEISKDQGHTWQKVFDTYYSRIDRKTYDATKLVQDQ
ncbi:MAG: hypothetical protein M3Z37_00765 [Candidatus Eremiobacteraeota bacterium]|nr:hypothetical protein [Candidatus Eremiobacteraeota bacterium]